MYKVKHEKIIKCKNQSILKNPGEKYILIEIEVELQYAKEF